MDDELLFAMQDCGLAYDMLSGYGCSADEAEFIMGLV